MTMTTQRVVGASGAAAPRRTLYRRSKHLLARLLALAWAGPRETVEPAIRRFLRDRPQSYLARLVGDRTFALAAAASLLAAGAARALPPVKFSDLAACSGDGGFVINGDPGDRSGRSVSGAGDVNGDGLADVIVGSIYGGGYFPGTSYVVFGSADGTAVDLSDVAAGVGGFAINGIPSPYFTFPGYSVSGAGDVNGDGLADVIVGTRHSCFYEYHDYCEGECYVVFGKADGTAVDLSEVAAGAGGFVISGIYSSGGSASGAGDVNGDGLADLIVGVDGGNSYVVFGKADGTPANLSDVAAGSGGFVMNGASGWSVSTAGDVNGDGLADVIVGDLAADPGGNSGAGESYVVFGKADETAVSLADVAAGTGGFVINGADPFDQSGYSVSAAGDVNGDGLADLLVGAPSADPGGNNFAGESYVVFGKADGTPVNLSDVAAGSEGFVMYGIDAYDASGRSVSGAGDLNGDGLADVIVGAPFADPGGNSGAGESYVVFGKADGTPVDLSDVPQAMGASSCTVSHPATTRAASRVPVTWTATGWTMSSWEHGGSTWAGSMRARATSCSVPCCAGISTATCR